MRHAPSCATVVKLNILDSITSKHLLDRNSGRRSEHVLKTPRNDAVDIVVVWNSISVQS